jgi:hydrogenase maturation factor
MGNGRVLVATADPVTFATDQIGRYAVYVNANDIACLGATPTWFLATVLLPESAPNTLAEEIFEQIRTACQELSVIPIGGHTEITIGIDRPIISGTMLGETTEEKLVRPGDGRPEDHILLTAGIAIEGTALLAREAADTLRSAGVSPDVIAAATNWLEKPGISIVDAARSALSTGYVRALHDPTEGGLSTALSELAYASELAASVRVEDVLVLAETSKICEALRLDPLGLLASGSLLIVAAPERCASIIERLDNEDIRATCIGDLTSGERGAIIDRRSQRSLPRFERDELARFLEALEESG